MNDCAKRIEIELGDDERQLYERLNGETDARRRHTG